jgi:hypothetical protein
VQHRTPLTVNVSRRKRLRPKVRHRGRVWMDRLRGRRRRRESLIFHSLHWRWRPRWRFVLLFFPLLVRVLELLGHEASRHVEWFLLFLFCFGKKCVRLGGSSLLASVVMKKIRSFVWNVFVVVVCLDVFC